MGKMSEKGYIIQIIQGRDSNYKSGLIWSEIKLQLGNEFNLKFEFRGGSMQKMSWKNKIPQASLTKVLKCSVS